MPTVSEELASWAANLQLEHVPSDVIEDAKLRILDTFGCAIAAVNEDVTRSARAAALSLAGQPTGSRIIGYGDVVTASAAALVNGTMAHALDFDDTHLEGNNHVSVPAVAAALAIGDEQGVTGEALLTSVIVGREVSCRIGIATPGVLVENGFHPTSVIGTISSAPQEYGSAFIGSPVQVIGVDSIRLIVTLGSAVLGSFIAFRVRAPGGVVLGAMIGSATATMVTCHDAQIPPLLRNEALAVIGASIGMVFTPAVLRHLRSILLSALLAAGLLIAAGVAITLLLRTIGLDFPNDLLATSPGAMSVMSAVAVEENSGLTEVTLFHTVRISLVVLTLPLLARLLENKPGRRPKIPGVPFAAAPDSWDSRGG